MSFPNSQRLHESTPRQTLAVKSVQITLEDGSQLTVERPPNGKAYYRVTDKWVLGCSIVEHEVNISYGSAKTIDTGPN